MKRSWRAAVSTQVVQQFNSFCRRIVAPLISVVPLGKKASIALLSSLCLCSVAPSDSQSATPSKLLYLTSMQRFPCLACSSFCGPSSVLSVCRPNRLSYQQELGNSCPPSNVTSKEAALYLSLAGWLACSLSFISFFFCSQVWVSEMQAIPVPGPVALQRCLGPKTPKGSFSSVEGLSSVSSMFARDRAIFHHPLQYLGCREEPQVSMNLSSIRSVADGADGAVKAHHCPKQVLVQRPPTILSHLKCIIFTFIRSRLRIGLPAVGLLVRPVHFFTSSLARLRASERLVTTRTRLHRSAPSRPAGPNAQCALRCSPGVRQAWI